MAYLDLDIPQLAQGLREVRLVQLFKKPGDEVRRDEPLYLVESDKATVAIESPVDGVLAEWLAEEDDVIEVGAVVARLQVGHPDDSGLTGEYGSSTAGARAETARSSGRPRIPPRTRAHCRRHGISEEEMRTLPAADGRKLMPADVDRHLAKQQGQPYQIRRLGPRQRRLAFRLRRSAQLVVPGTLTAHLDWNSVQQARQGTRMGGSPGTELEVLAFAIARAAAAHPLLRSTLLGHDTVREHRHLNLGIAVHQPDGGLETAVIPAADALDWPDFVTRCRDQIRCALQGQDQPTDSTQVLLSFLADHEVVSAVPVLVAPAVAVVCVASPQRHGASMVANLTVTFDHRLLNGVEIAQFAGSIRRRLRDASQLDLGDSDAHGPKPFTTPPHLDMAALQQAISCELARVAGGSDQGELEVWDVEVPFADLGITSRMALELVERLSTRFDFPFPNTLLWSYPTIKAVAAHVAERLTEARMIQRP